jgi:hypothetical protein
MSKKIIKQTTAEKKKINFKSKKDEGFVCVSCGYTGHGVVDEETHSVICPDCGANLEENDILKLETPDSYEDENEGFKDDLSLDELDSRITGDE